MSIDKIVEPYKKWGTKYSLWPIHLVTACCGVEMAHTWNPAYDAERLGSLPWHAPRQTNRNPGGGYRNLQDGEGFEIRLGADE
jgi:NADH:ubiquinone oxidoreductase 20 kD subunit and related Fe-S oxidoreductases